MHTSNIHKFNPTRTDVHMDDESSTSSSDDMKQESHLISDYQLVSFHKEMGDANVLRNTQIFVRGYSHCLDTESKQLLLKAASVRVSNVDRAKLKVCLNEASRKDNFGRSVFTKEAICNMERVDTKKDWLTIKDASENHTFWSYVDAANFRAAADEAIEAGLIEIGLIYKVDYKWQTLSMQERNEQRRIKKQINGWDRARKYMKSLGGELLFNEDKKKKVYAEREHRKFERTQHLLDPAQIESIMDMQSSNMSDEMKAYEDNLDKDEANLNVMEDVLDNMEEEQDAAMTYEATNEMEGIVQEKNSKSDVLESLRELCIVSLTYVSLTKIQQQLEWDMHVSDIKAKLQELQVDGLVSHQPMNDEMWKPHET